MFKLSLFPPGFNGNLSLLSHMLIFSRGHRQMEVGQPFEVPLRYGWKYIYTACDPLLRARNLIPAIYLALPAESHGVAAFRD